MTQRGRSAWIPLLVILGTMVAIREADARPTAVPSLVGRWKIVSWAVAGYDNAWDLNSTPKFESGVPTDVLIVITDQKAGAFAGYVTQGEGKNLLTGVIASDNTVLIQAVEGNGRLLFTGKYSVAGKKKTIKGAFFDYEESTASEPGMSNGFMELEKK